MRVTRLPPGLVLYRGLGGLMSLPEAFYRAAADGCIGFAEWGFFSTTSNRAVAIQVHSRPASPLPTVSLGALRYIPQPTCPPACMYSYLRALRGLGGTNTYTARLPPSPLAYMPVAYMPVCIRIHAIVKSGRGFV